MEEFYTELMLEEIRHTDPEFYLYIRGELDDPELPGEYGTDDDDPEGDLIA